MSIRDAEFARWLVSSMGSGVVAVDAAGRVKALSPGAARLLDAELQPEQALGLDARRVLAAQPMLARLLLDTLEGRELPSRAELRLEGAAAAPGRTIGFTVLPVRDDAGRLRGAALLFRDLTPYERMDEQERLRERLAALGQMAAGLAHQIRNPLAGMEVLAGLLRRRLEQQPDERALVEEFVGELRALAETVSASLEFVRPVALARVRVDPAKLLEECLAVACSRVPFEGRVDRDVQPDAGELWGDVDQLRAVLTDLIVNALEAMSAEPGPEARLALGMRREGRAAPVLRMPGSGSPGGSANGRFELVISIADTGPGVAPELAERIFYPFFTTKERGSGVGLANAQKVVASHGGSIELDSRPGCGALFRVRLPLGDSP